MGRSEGEDGIRLPILLFVAQFLRKARIRCAIPGMSEWDVKKAQTGTNSLVSEKCVVNGWG